MNKNPLTPFENSKVSAFHFSSNVYASYVIASLIEVAKAMEADYSVLGEGHPPLELVTDVYAAWNNVCMMSAIEE